MPLVVPVLRLAYVFLNVFETFKTLRLPPPSSRNGGQPSVRAMSQRKRAMKGCMTVWLVWACFIIYERWAEVFVYLVVPFYSEIKSLFILFFLMTRAKGAEPVYLHVIRPLIKPYTAPLDALFACLFSFADLLILIASIPVNYVLDYYYRLLARFNKWYRPWFTAYDPPQADPQTWHQDEPAVPRPANHRAYVSELITTDRPSAARDNSTTSVPQTCSTIQRSDADTPTQKIWRPPVSAYNMDNDDEAGFSSRTGLPTPPIEAQERHLAAGSPGSDDWRQYPPFPAAYPPTPLAPSSRLPYLGEPIAAPKPVRPGMQFAGIEEEDSDEETPETQQGFRRSLLLPREPPNPGSDGDSSDENRMKGVQHTQTQHTSSTTTHINDRPRRDSETEMSVDETPATARAADTDIPMNEDDDEDDDTTRPYAPPSRGANTGTTRSDALTRQHGKPFHRTQHDGQRVLAPYVLAQRIARVDEPHLPHLPHRLHESSKPAPIPAGDAPSLAGKKRRLPPRYAEDEVRFSLNVPARKKVAAAGGATMRSSSRASSRVGTVGRRKGQAVQATLLSNSDSDSDGERAEKRAKGEDGEEYVPSDSSSGAKRKRVAAGGRVPRPAPKRGDSQGTTKKSSVGSKGKAVANTQAAKASKAK
ncbi:uncharacterized protein BXZ73DRAFT_97222 [Epithele typhae]|uniref:uncharacterized protein n=1 Tax=Epithele typhae TaxID=378194 RepID=UPI0020080F29|nr:uncharacterized protein BXZ73DRAFT_97222 [Epithele typhae]KAH9943168.1 hypothetical protein BXZ73DRAFT_97222 [Epithele typhae]